MTASALQMVRPTIRHFSVRRPQPDTRTSRFVTHSCLFSAVVLPFIPPALESSREKNQGYPTHNNTSNILFLQAPSPTVLPRPVDPGVDTHVDRDPSTRRGVPGTSSIYVTIYFTAFPTAQVAVGSLTFGRLEQEEITRKHIMIQGKGTGIYFRSLGLVIPLFLSRFALICGTSSWSGRDHL
ncbi:hypothetical protein BDV59DRAFT_12195 [Aspergillus ambiguus]|uniref:uncharacterized protein n=1 Tax=Aspergillus ambiguus TaxID=176160 RepID=UPI003CCCE9E3